MRALESGLTTLPDGRVSFGPMQGPPPPQNQSPTPPKCIACGSPHVTAPTNLSLDGGFARLQWKERATGKLFDAITNRASVCLACGHVAMSFDAHQLGMVRARIGDLVAF